MTRLLILTQAVDLDDPVLGFFHAWIAGLARTIPQVDVLCLKEGRHALPTNVRVSSLGKGRHSCFKRIRYITAFFSYIVTLRSSYDTVFVHMNEEYVLMGGLFWRLLGKRVVLWRNHRMGSWKTWMAMRLANRLCYTSEEAYVAHARHAVRMPIGIDTELFVPGSTPTKEDILFLGRLDPIKKADVFIAALKALPGTFRASLYGDPTDPESPYAARVREAGAELAGKLSFHGKVRHDETPDLYRAHPIYVNLTPSGSFDKTIGEAMASGCLVVTANDAVRDVMPDALMTDGTIEDTARALSAALALGDAERAAVRERQRAYVEREHSLTLLVSQLSNILKP